MARPYGLTEASCDRFSNASTTGFEGRRVKVTSHMGDVSAENQGPREFGLRSEDRGLIPG